MTTGKKNRIDFVIGHFVVVTMPGEKYLVKLDLEITFEEIAKMNTNKFKKLLKEKTMEAVFKYLIEEKNKQKKMCDIEYKGWK